MKLAVIFATVGRSETVSEALEFIREQTRQPDIVILSAVSEVDVPPLPPGLPIEVVFGPKGLPAQRNLALRATPQGIDVVVFFDDDFAPGPSYLEQVESILNSDPNISGLTGHVIADGIGGPGYTFAEARKFLAEHTARPLLTATRTPQWALYGCNMVIRTRVATGLAFDEALPLYGWQEDVAFTYQLGRRGQLLKTDALVGVHLGVKGSRSSGLMIGYAQIANPIFLYNRQSLPFLHAYSQMLRNLAANFLRSVRPEPWCDRRGRLAGNLRAIGDLFRGTLHPRNILDLK